MSDSDVKVSGEGAGPSKPGLMGTTMTAKVDVIAYWIWTSRRQRINQISWSKVIIQFPA